VFETDIVNTGETKECFFGLFILLYCLSLYSRLRQKTVALAAPVAPPEE
jgi:hypothetical protein